MFIVAKEVSVLLRTLYAFFRRLEWMLCALGISQDDDYELASTPPELLGPRWSNVRLLS